MPKLKPHLQFKPTRAKVSEILVKFGYKLVEFSALEGGIENITLLVTTNKGKFVLRVYRKNKKSLKEIQRELAFMDFLRKNGLPVPGIVASKIDTQMVKYIEKTNIWTCVLMEFMSGKHTRQFSPGLLRELAKTQALMHNLGVKFKSGKPVNELSVLRDTYLAPKIKLSEIKNVPLRDALQRAKKHKFFLDPRLSLGYCHLDLTHHNFLVDKNRVSAVLDFDDLCYAPLVVCLGYTLYDVYYLTRNLQNINAYIREYVKHRKLKKIELLALKDVLKSRMYQNAALEMIMWGEKGSGLKDFLKFEKVFNSLVISL